MERQALALRTVELDLMPRWSFYTKERQERLRQFAGEVVEARWEQGFATLKEAAAVSEVYKELAQQEGEFMDFLKNVYQASWRTGYARLELYREARKKLSEEQIAYLVAYGPGLMPYRNVPIGEFINAAKGLSAPKTEKPEDMDAFISRVGVRFKEMKSERRKSGQKRVSTDEAVKEAFNSLLGLISSAKLKTTQRQLEFLERVVGMVMYDRAIPGKISTGRVEVPEGFKIKRGRPRTKIPESNSHAA